jgi:hypothetical protein
MLQPPGSSTVMPQLLSVRKKARVPATCSASVRARQSVEQVAMLRLSALIQPAGLPSASVSIFRRAASAALVLQPERLDAPASG